MNRCFLLNEAFRAYDIEQLIKGCDELVLIEKDCNDKFYKHDLIYSTQSYLEICSYQNQSAQFIIEFLERNFINSDRNLSSEEELDLKFYPNPCAFLGVDFSHTDVTENRRVIDQTSYELFKRSLFSSVMPNNLWLWKEVLFPNLILCEGVKGQVDGLGNSSHFSQVVERLKTLNDYAQNWNSGNFSYQELNRTTSLRVSPESETTMNKYGDQRIYSLPDKSRKSFELHIKTGDLRFHFYPCNIDYVIYIGYIGPHLDI
jgi:hypothetical protein